MSEQTQQQGPTSWATRRDEKARRMQAVRLLSQEKLVKSLESLTVAEDRIVPEGDNRKQASTRIFSRYPGDLRFGDDPWSGR